jgi:hypothetical protein
MKRCLPLLAAALAITSSGCASSAPSHGAAPPAKAGCPLHLQDAKQFIGTTATPYTAPTVQGVAPPLARCMYRGTTGGWVQVTEFSGSNMFNQFRALIASAPQVDGLGSNGYCNTTNSASTSTYSCLLMAKGQTYILALHLPATEAGVTLHSNFQAFAVRFAQRVAG